MQDPFLVVGSLIIAGIVARDLMLLFGQPWREPRPLFVQMGWVLAVGSGFYLGWYLLGGYLFNSWPKWPPREGQDRLLFVLLPALIVIELLAAVTQKLPWLIWPLRILLAAAAGRVLLHGISYLESPFEDERWTSAQQYQIFGGLAAALVAEWGLLALLAWRVPSRSIPLTLALSCAAAGFVVALSGNSTAAPLGLTLTASLVGATVASLFFPGRVEVGGSIGFGVVGLFGLLVLGCGFAELTMTHAIILFFAPLLCWLAPWPKSRPWLNGCLRIALVAIPLTIVGVQAFGTAQDKYHPPTESTPDGGDEAAYYKK